MQQSMWRPVLEELVDQGSFRTQHDLVQAIRARTGIDINQATVSRELQQLGARKIDGVYQIGPQLSLADRVHSIEVTAQGCMIVIRTEPAFASVVAQRVDRSGIEGVLGTIAGDDTVFVATKGQESLPGLRLLLTRKSGPGGS